jgi:hypothetical protein
MKFKTHTGEIVTGARLQDALNRVAQAWADNAKDVRTEDRYASHVAESEKDDYLREELDYAESIRQGNIDCFTIWQRVNAHLTGECVAYLPE